MKVTKIALAAAVALVAAQAQAATVYLTGASATQNSYRLALQSLCADAGGTQTTIISPADTNLSAVKCTTDFAGLPGVNAVSINVSGGSFTAVTSSIGNDLKQFVDPANNAGTTLAGPLASAGGFLDIDAASFPASDYATFGVASVPSTEPAAFAQVFGLAVSNAMYTALQTKQGLTGCGVDSVTPACQPTISKAQYTSIANDDFNSAKETKGAGLFLGAAFDGQDVVKCRRVSTSGTQSSSNEFFLKNFIGSDGAVAGAQQPADGVLYASGQGLPYSVNEGSGTGNTRACLSTNTYAVGVLSLENAPDLTTRAGGARADRKWRFVKINGVHAYEPAVNSTATAKSGDYEFWFTSQKFGATPTGTAVVNAIDAKLNAVNIPGVFSVVDSDVKRASNVGPISFK